MHTFQIQKITYEFIRNNQSLSFKHKNLLLHHINKYVATQKRGDELFILVETIGKRDECSEFLRKIVEQLLE